jgi:hypothetical protein
VRDFAFYNAGVDGARGTGRLLAPARRLLRRILRPIFFRQEAIYREMQDEIDRLRSQVDALSDRTATTDAFGWDYLAMARRLAAIEDHLSRADASAGGRRDDAPNRVPAHHLGRSSVRPNVLES